MNKRHTRPAPFRFNLHRFRRQRTYTLPFEIEDERVHWSRRRLDAYRFVLEGIGVAASIVLAIIAGFYMLTIL